MVIVLTVRSCRLSGCELGDVGGFAAFDWDCCDCCCCCCCWDDEDDVVLTAETLAGDEAGVLLSPWRRSATPLPKSLITCSGEMAPLPPVACPLCLYGVVCDEW